jgi:hypothetical protein
MIRRYRFDPTLNPRTNRKTVNGANR